MAAWEVTIGGLVQGEIEAWENWPEGYATPNRCIMYGALNWCQEHHTEIIDTLRTLLGAYPMVMPASIEVVNDPALRDRFERWRKTASIKAVERHKLYKRPGNWSARSRRPAYALREVLRRKLPDRTQPERPRGALGEIPRHGGRLLARTEVPRDGQN